MGRPRSP
ncbi:predicted protein [Fibroporia radiculosa]|nr:predicted protein [Fibroporia radiculosa]